MSPRQPIEVQRGLVASLDRHDEGAGSVPTPRAERQSGRDRERQLLCPACGRATTHRLLYAKNGCDILQCASAGSVAPRRASSIPARYYTGDYFSGGHADGYADYRGAEPVLRREFANTVNFIRKYRASGRLLDVGCAYGFFLQEARRYFDVAGIELAEDAAAYCRQTGSARARGVADENTLAQLGSDGRHRRCSTSSSICRARMRRSRCARAISIRAASS